MRGFAGLVLGLCVALWVWIGVAPESKAIEFILFLIGSVSLIAITFACLIIAFGTKNDGR